MSDDTTAATEGTGIGWGGGGAGCRAMRAGAAAGARPGGVPLRVYGAYLEARAALRANAYTLANRTLEWLLGHLAEERGARAEESLAAKVEQLRRGGAL